MATDGRYEIMSGIKHETAPDVALPFIPPAHADEKPSSTAPEIWQDEHVPGELQSLGFEYLNASKPINKLQCIS